MRKLLATVLLASALAVPASADEPAFKVIVHRSNPADAISTAKLQAIFAKTETRWPSGTTAQPVELRGDPAARQEFARRVHGKSLTALKSYWNKQIFSGREVPPLEMASDDEIVSFVRANAGAVGVVSASAATGGTKVLTLTD
jgi:ABC-type phosphate transport system substrate-binding protein